MPVTDAPTRVPLPLLQRILGGLLGFSLRHPGAFLLAAAMVVAVLATGVPRMRVILSLGDLEEEALPSTVRNREMKDVFGVGHSLGLVLVPQAPDGAFTADDIRRIREWIGRERADDDALVRVISAFELARPVVRGFFGWHTVPLLVEGTPAERRGLLDSPWGGILTDRTGRDLAVEFAFKDTPGGGRYGSFDPAAVGALARRCAASLAPPGGVRAHLIGPTAFQYYALEGIRKFRVLNLAILALLLVMLRLLLGTWRAGVLLCGVLILAGLTVYGAMSLAGAPIDFLSTGLFLMLSVAALEDYLFLSYQQLQHRTDWRALFPQMLLPGFLTSLTTVIGFLSLCVSDLAIIRRFGLWAAFGATVEWVVTFLLLPAFMQIVPFFRTWTDPERSWRPGLPARLVALSLPRRVLFALLAVYVIAIPAALRLESSDSIVSLFGRSHPFRQGLEYLRESRGWVADISLVFPDVRREEENATVLASIARHPNVARVIDPYAIRSYMSRGRPEGPMKPGGREARPGSGFRALVAEDGRMRAILYLRDVGLDRMNATLQAIRESCGGIGCYPAGDLVSYAEFASRVPSVLFKSFGTCLVLVGLLLAGLLHATGHGRPLPILTASFWGPALMIGLLWLLRVPLTFLTCVFASVQVGLTGDNTIQYLLARPDRPVTAGLGLRGGASILVALVMGLACLVFLGSSFVPSRRLGLLLAAGLLASAFGDIWILKGLIGEVPPPRRNREDGAVFGQSRGQSPEDGNSTSPSLE